MQQCLFPGWHQRSDKVTAQELVAGICSEIKLLLQVTLCNNMPARVKHC